MTFRIGTSVLPGPAATTTKRRVLKKAMNRRIKSGCEKEKLSTNLAGREFSSLLSRKHTRQIRIQIACIRDGEANKRRQQAAAKVREAGYRLSKSRATRAAPCKQLCSDLEGRTPELSP
jgi:hypothetical protein